METALQLNLPGIDYAPLKVRRYGLQEAHTYPLVSDGKDPFGNYRGAFRVPAQRAWDFPELELGRTGNSIPCLLFDMDGDPTDWLADVFGPDVPRPNWITWRKSNYHAHLAYTLARPVLTGRAARPTPQRFLARAGEYMAAKLKADTAYNAVLAHNPMSRGHKGKYRTDWLREEPYRLEELAAYVPKGWRRPVKQPATIYGRNCALFDFGMRWSGKPANWGDWGALELTMRATNAGFSEPLDEGELSGLIDRVTRYQMDNLGSGRTQRTFHFRQKARGKKGGKQSGEVRRMGTPLEYDPTPWLTEGVSKATWYRHRKGEHTGEHTGPRGRPEPWKAAGLSRATWYRRGNRIT